MTTKKYILIKDYPGSPKLGTIVDRRGVFVYFDINSPNVNMTISENYVGNYPEFWEEIVKDKDYEILSYHCKSLGHTLKSSQFIDSQFGGNTEWTIYSVKRLSDGEIFTIGDRIYSAYQDYYINKISVIKNILFVDGLKDLSKPDGSRIHYRLLGIKKRQPLFITKDNVKLFNADIYYQISYDFRLLKYLAVSDTQFDNSLIIFSSKESAEKYILMNKPCLSVNDVLSVCYSRISDSAKLAIEESLK